MSKLRFKVVESAFEKKVEDAPIPEKRVSEYYGSHVFNRAKMFKYLPEKVYEKLVDCIDNNGLWKWERPIILIGSIL